jgi:serine/threonine protein kinase
MFLLASGSYGKVFKTYDGKIIKRVELVSNEVENEPELSYTTIRELAFLSKFKHPNIISKSCCKIKGEIPSNVDIYLHDGGITLSQYFKQQTIKDRSRSIAYIAFQCIKALYYLEVNNIAHLDIKLSNIVINPKNKHVCLIDFGGCIFNPTDNDMVWCSTQGYRPPEHLKNSKQKYVVNTRCDIFSFGLSMFAYFFGEIPDHKYIPDEKYDLFKAFKNKSIDDLCNLQDITILKILYSCINMDNNKRPKASELYYMSYFKKFRKYDTFKYTPLINSISTEYKSTFNEFIESDIHNTLKNFVKEFGMTKLYSHAMTLLDKILDTIDLEPWEKEIKYISLFCLHISYLLFDNCKFVKDDMFYNYEDYNVCFIDIANKILPALDFDVYIKLI